MGKRSGPIRTRRKDMPRHDISTRRSRHRNRGGFQGLGETCLDQLPPEPPGLQPYNGLLDSHAYSVAPVPGGWVVGDAAGNDLVKVSANGRRSTLAVLPPVSTLVTAEMAAE